MSRSETIITRLFIDQRLTHSEVLALAAPQSHLVRNVLRAQAGQSVGLFNGLDGEWRGEITALAKSAVTVRVMDKRRDQAPSPDVWLGFAPLKKDAVDMIATKATELGVSRLSPIMTERTAVSRINIERLRANAIEAAEQCERLDVPVIDEPRPLSQTLAVWPTDRPLLVCAEAGDAVPIGQAAHDLNTTAYGLMIGPEGGFSMTELDQMASLSFVRPVGLGPRILRADTAAIAGLAICMGMTGMWADRPPNEAAFYSRTTTGRKQKS